MSASKTAQQWNRAMSGEPRPPAPRQQPGGCNTPDCGALRGGIRGRTGWVAVEVVGSTEPPRLYCSGQCATYGIALAELRVPGGAL